MLDRERLDGLPPRPGRALQTCAHHAHANALLQIEFLDRFLLCCGAEYGPFFVDARQPAAAMPAEQANKNASRMILREDVPTTWVINSPRKMGGIECPEGGTKAQHDSHPECAEESADSPQQNFLENNRASWSTGNRSRVMSRANNRRPAESARPARMFPRPYCFTPR